MKTRKLGRSGPEVSAIGLGCMGMASFYGQPSIEAEASAVIHRALDLGVTFLDTAEMYGPHTNEIQIGKALADRRDRAFVATKFGIGFNAERTRQRSGAENREECPLRIQCSFSAHRQCLRVQWQWG